MTTDSIGCRHRADHAGAVATRAPDEPTLGHVTALDGLRGVAAILVVLFHARIPGFDRGFLGVDVFFVLSGFLITSLLVDRLALGRGVEYRRFYGRRARRLLPAYVAVVLAALAWQVVTPVGGTLRGVLSSAVYASNWVPALSGAGLGLLDHTWSLSIEEQFYVLWPALLAGAAALARRDLPRLAMLVAGGAAASYLLSVVLLELTHAPVDRVWFGTDTRSFQLLAGAALAVTLAHRRRCPGPARFGPVPPGVARASGWVGLAGLVLALSPWVPHTGAEVVLVAWPLHVAVALLLILAGFGSAGTVRRALSARPLVAVGQVSYGLYLWHFPVFLLIDAQVGLQGFTPRAVGLAITAVLTVVSWRYIETPFLRRQHRT